MRRPSFESITMRYASDISKRSTCHRMQVGTVITTTDFSQVLSIGYNGNSKGFPNKCDNRHAVGACGCIHSEINASIKCNVPSYVEKFVFVTCMPCVNCAKIIVNLGNVRKVFYKNEYRSKQGFSVFKKAKISFKRIK